MTALDLADIQGNIHRPYGRYGFPYTRHLFFNLGSPAAGRRFVDALRRDVTTAAPWPKDAAGKTVKPAVTMNLGFTFQGLRALDLPTETLRLLPDEFIDGMACRAGILGDVGASAPEHWDGVWHDAAAVHVWVSLNVGAEADGRPVAALDVWTERLAALASDGVTLLAGHGATGERWQDSAALREGVGPGGAEVFVAKEHFGFVDGISDPVFTGQFDPDAEALAVIGGGKYESAKGWSPLAAGEFILGQVDEGQEVPATTEPASFARNGTFMVYRKLRQDVAAWDKDVVRLVALWQAVTGDAADAAEATVRAKIVGRWPSGLPLLVAPTWADHQRLVAEYADCLEIALRTPRDEAERKRLDQYTKLLTGFRYGGDRDGQVCPLGAHIRRSNPRDMLDPKAVGDAAASTLTNRRRILRRGLPYVDPGGDKGVIFMAMCASLFRQFEFVQQQWMNYGLDFDAGNDTCPLIGSRGRPEDGERIKHVIPAGPANAATVIAADLPEFVATRGGDYFFIPGMNALRMIAMGTIDPT